MHPDRQAIFVFESPEPTTVVVYPDLDWARESLESQDVAGNGYEPAFTENGQIVELAPTDDLLAELDLREQVNLELLRSLLGKVHGPAHLADNPSADAREWLRLNDLESQQPLWTLRRLSAWYRDNVRRARKP